MREVRSSSSSAAEVLGRATRAGAQEALASLINQFADPYAFLRELVQNSLDAGSTQIDVDASFEPDDDEEGGVATITVADNGEGMNELVIDRHLLTLFSSTKEDDLTKIGKFGIGFVSIFAIEPDLVVLETGQAGEAWRVIFHADARYEKLRIEQQPVEGTTVKLHKRIDRQGFEELEQRAKETVSYWCKYAEAEIAVNGEPVQRPFDLDADLCVRHSEPGTEIIVGFAPPGRGPLVGFYNRGLTLVEGERLPGDEADLAGLCFRIKSRYLEHTLTRDNVLQDESYDKAMALVRRQVDQRLRPRLVARLVELARRDGEGDEGGAALTRACFGYAQLPSMFVHQRKELAGAPILPTTDSGPVSLKQARKARSPVGALLLASRSNPLTRALAADGCFVLEAVEGLASWLGGSCGLRVIDANVCLVTAVPVEISDDATGRWLALVRELVGALEVRVDGVQLGELGYPDSLAAAQLYLRQKVAFAVSVPGERPRLLGGARQLVLNRSHTLIRRCLGLAEDRVPLAALLCVQAISALEGADPLGAAALGVGTMALAGEQPVVVAPPLETEAPDA